MGAAPLNARRARQQHSAQCAHLPPRAPHQIYQAWQRKRFTVITANIQLEEIRRASRYPKFRDVLQPHRVGRMLNNLRGAEIIHPLHGEYEVADPNDAWLLALADTGWANHLVTGDKRSGLLARGRVGAANILTAAAFCELLRGATRNLPDEQPIDRGLRDASGPRGCHAAAA